VIGYDKLMCIHRLRVAVHWQSAVIAFEPDAELSIEASAPFQVINIGVLDRERDRDKRDFL